MDAMAHGAAPRRDRGRRQRDGVLLRRAGATCRCTRPAAFCFPTGFGTLGLRGAGAIGAAVAQPGPAGGGAGRRRRPDVQRPGARRGRRGWRRLPVVVVRQRRVRRDPRRRCGGADRAARRSTCPNRTSRRWPSPSAVTASALATAADLAGALTEALRPTPAPTAADCREGGLRECRSWRSSGPTTVTGRQGFLVIDASGARRGQRRAAHARGLHPRRGTRPGPRHDAQGGDRLRPGRQVRAVRRRQGRHRLLARTTRRPAA